MIDRQFLLGELARQLRRLDDERLAAGGAVDHRALQFDILKLDRQRRLELRRAALLWRRCSLARVQGHVDAHDFQPGDVDRRLE
jgi:hypothetical protein